MPKSPKGRGAKLRISSKPPGRRSAKNWRVLTLFRKAQGAIAAGEVGPARELLERCLEMDGRDAYCWLSLARLEASAARAELTNY